MIALVIAWLLIQLVGVIGVSEPLGKLIKQVLAVVGVVLFILACFGVNPVPCLTRWPG